MRDARLLKQVRLVWRLGEELYWHRVSDLSQRRDYPYAAKPHYSDTLMNTPQSLSSSREFKDGLHFQTQRPVIT